MYPPNTVQRPYIVNSIAIPMETSFWFKTWTTTGALWDTMRPKLSPYTAPDVQRTGYSSVKNGKEAWLRANMIKM